MLKSCIVFELYALYISKVYSLSYKLQKKIKEFYNVVECWTF